MKNKILGRIAGVFGLRLAYSALTFLTSVLLARVLGTSGFGAYTYAVVWAYLLSVPATMGFDNFLVREIAVYQTQSLWGLMRGLLSWANKVVLVSSSALAAIAILVAFLLDGGAQSEVFVGFCLAMALMPVISLRNVRRGAMKGLHKIAKGMLPELLIDPLILIVLTLAAYAVLKESLTSLWVVVFYGLGSLATLALVSQFLARSLPEKVTQVPAVFKGRAWISGALPFMLIESIPILNSRLDVLMLGAYQGTDAVGLYVPVNRGAQLITFILMAVGSSLAPTIASAYSDNRLGDLQRMVTKGVRVVAVVAFLFAGSLSLLSQGYLSLFGPEFVQGQTALYIFCVGGFMSTTMSLSYVILNMTGFERYTAIVGWLAIGLNVVLNAILIPRWGVEGAALATSLGTTLGAFVCLVAVRQKLGVDATILGLALKPPTVEP
ncbi:MAG: oligosaccharide flippase family protein [Cyanobacteria bacterium P01_A01_bin.116]